MAKILIVDDDESICTLFSRIFASEEHTPFVAQNAAELFECLQATMPEIVLLDVNLPDAQGYDLVPKILEVDPFVHVLMISGEMTVEAAMNAMKMGAFDYLSKPFTRLTLMHAINQALDARRISIHAAASERVLSHDKPSSLTRLIGSTRAICSFNIILDRFAKNSNSPVMIIGEIGTPKQHVARALHDLSNRRSNPFFHLKCSTIPRPLMMAELFGDSSARDSSKSRGLLELTEGGTLYLSEVEQLDDRCSQALVELIQANNQQMNESSTQVTPSKGTRLVFSSETRLGHLAEMGEFNAQLNALTKAYTITVPTLVQQIEDLEELSNHYLKEINGLYGRHFNAFSPDIKKFLRTYSWPGNHQELYNLIERMVLLTPKSQMIIDIGILKRLMFLDPSDKLTDSDGPFYIDDYSDKDSSEEEAKEDDQYFEPIPLSWVEKEYIQKVLKHFDYDLRVTAIHLGISTSTLNRKLAVLEIALPPTPRPLQESLLEP